MMTAAQDLLLGNAPNLYVYACNNPSESLLAKRRGYATIISHNVPPYAKSGLYKELAQLRELIADFRSVDMRQQQQQRGSTESSAAVAGPGGELRLAEDAKAAAGGAAGLGFGGAGAGGATASKTMASADGKIFFQFV